jgi:hypothetical protein
MIYHEIDDHGDYLIGADVAKGVGREERRDPNGNLLAAGEGDYSVAIVLDERKRVVAKFRGQVDPDYFADILEAMGYLWNTAKLAVELNNHGILPNTRLAKIRPIRTCTSAKSTTRYATSIRKILGSILT